MIFGCKYRGDLSAWNAKWMFAFQIICHVCFYIGRISRKVDIGKWKTFPLLGEIASNWEICTDLKIHVLRQNTFSKYICMKFEYLHSVECALYHLSTCRAFQQRSDDSIRLRILCYICNNILECKHRRARIVTLTWIASLNFYCTKYHQFLVELLKLLEFTLFLCI